MPKKKGAPRGNPTPVQTPEFLAKKFPPAPDVPAGVALGTPVCVALPLPVDTAVRSLPNRSEWLRRVITEAAQRDLLSHCSNGVLPEEVSGLNQDQEVLG
jgi:hypothetical protein